jgi:hypothetical protein
VEARGFEPLTSGMQILRSPKLSYAPKYWLRGQDLNLRPLGYEPNELPGCSTPRHYSMVGLGRLELPTSRLSGVRSNQLSYRPLTLYFVQSKFLYLVTHLVLKRTKFI